MKYLDSSNIWSYIVPMSLIISSSWWGKADMTFLSHLWITKFSIPCTATSPTVYLTWPLRVPIPWTSTVSVDVLVANDMIKGDCGTEDLTDSKDKLE